MGQYWKVINLTKREYILAHELGCGLKLWEQLVNRPGTAQALVILLAAMPVARGGGDLEEDDVVGRWAGDRIALVGDYAEKGDLAQSGESESRSVFADTLYDLCGEPEEGEEPPEPVYTNISHLVRPVLEREFGGKYEERDYGWTYIADKK